MFPFYRQPEIMVLLVGSHIEMARQNP